MGRGFQETSQMRILLVTPTYHPSIGGIETYVADLANELSSLGCDVQVAHIRTSIGKYKKEIVSGITVHRIPARGIGPFVWFDPLSKFVGPVDVIDVNDPHQAGLALHFLLFRSRYPKSRLLLTTHGGFFHTTKYSLLKEIYLRLVVPSVLFRYDLVIFDSMGDSLIYRSAVSPGKTALLECGVRTERFERLAKRKGEALRFIYYGRISKNKNVPHLVDVFLELSRLIPAELHVVGRGEELELARIRAGDSSAVRFHPFLEDEELDAVLATCRYFVTATKYEGFGISIIEAMAAGRIVIGNDIPSLRRLVDHETNGILLPFDAAAPAVATRLRQLVERPLNELVEFSSAAQVASQKHSWRAKRAQLRQIFGLAALQNGDG
jgi:alpha-1,3-mannosyltransferase